LAVSVLSVLAVQQRCCASTVESTDYPQRRLLPQVLEESKQKIVKVQYWSEVDGQWLDCGEPEFTFDMVKIWADAEGVPVREVEFGRTVHEYRPGDAD
jgi:hypothetical protein